MNTCPTCEGPLEWVDFAHDNSMTAIWCPSCNFMWEPHEQPPRPDPPAPPMDRTHIIEVRALKNYLERQKQIRDQRRTPA